MLTALKDIFRPTWKKVVGAVLLTVCLAFAALLFVGQRHGPDWHDYATAILMPPVMVVRLLSDMKVFGTHGAGDLPLAAILWGLQLIYAYTIVCLGSLVISKTLVKKR